MSADNIEQVAKQCDAVAHMAEALAQVHRDRAKLLREGFTLQLADMLGKATAYRMEVLGDILNGMDAIDAKEDGWMDPVFAEAHRLWPQEAA